MNSEFEFLEARLRRQLPELTDAYSNIDRGAEADNSVGDPSSAQTISVETPLDQTGFEQATQVVNGPPDPVNRVLGGDEPVVSPLLPSVVASPTRRRRYLVGVAAAAVVVCLGLLAVAGLGDRGDSTSTDVADGSMGELGEAFEADRSSNEDSGSKNQYSKSGDGEASDAKTDETDSVGTSDSGSTSEPASKSEKDDRTSTDSDADSELVDVESLDPGCGVVPNLVGLSLGEAEQRGRANEPVVVIEQTADLSYNPAIFKEGEITSQTRAGSVICERTVVAVSYAKGSGVSSEAEEVATGATTTTTRPTIASTTTTTSKPKDDEPTCAAIPNLVGLSFDQANRVGNSDLYSVAAHVTDGGATGDHNIVVGQSPDAGTVVCSNGAPGRITIAFPPRTDPNANCNVVPNLVGLTAAAAMAQGPDTFIHVQQIPDISYDYDAIPLGQVTKQSISPGTVICGPDIRSLNISIAAGSTPPTHASTTTTIDDYEFPTCITMPNYVGDTIGDAAGGLATYVSKAGMSFDLNIVKVPTSDYNTALYSPGEVVAQSVSASTKICSAQQVTLTYAE